MIVADVKEEDDDDEDDDDDDGVALFVTIVGDDEDVFLASKEAGLDGVGRVDFE